MSKRASIDPSPSRRRILRDLIVFQVKLWLEGFKDVVLVPISFGAAVIDVLFHKRTGPGMLYTVMKYGEQFEGWVDLYSPLTNMKAEAPQWAGDSGRRGHLRTSDPEPSLGATSGRVQGQKSEEKTTE